MTKNEFFVDQKQFKKLLEEDNFEGLVKMLKLGNGGLCEPNYSKGFYELGKLFEQSNHILKDDQKAEMIKKFGIEKSSEKAILCYWKSFLLGYNKAAEKLNNFYYLDQDGKRDLKKAMLLYEMGEKRGDAFCIYKLGLCNFRGDGMKKDFNKAFHYFFRSSAINPNFGSYELGIIFEKGFGSATCCKRRAFQFFKVGAEAHNKYCLLKCGKILSSTTEAKKFGQTKNSELSKKYLKEFLMKCTQNDFEKHNGKRQNVVETYAKSLCQCESKEDRLKGVKLALRKTKHGNKSLENFLIENTNFGKIVQNPQIDVQSFVGTR